MACPGRNVQMMLVAGQRKNASNSTVKAIS